MERAKDQLELKPKHLNINGGQMKVKFEKAMRNAKESMLKAKEELKNIKDFTNALEKDGLIDKKKNYKIEVRSGELYINDTKQSKEVSEKYRKYYRKENFTISMNENEGVRI